MTGQDVERGRTGCGCGKQILLRIAHELAPGTHQKAWPLPLRLIVRTSAPATRATPAEQSRDFILTLLNPRHRRFLIRGFPNMRERADEGCATTPERSAVSPSKPVRSQRRALCYGSDVTAPRHGPVESCPYHGFARSGHHESRCGRPCCRHARAADARRACRVARPQGSLN